MSLDIKQVQGFIDMDDRIFPEYRRKIYNYLKMTLSSVMTEDDLNLIVLMIAELFGDLYMRAKLLPWEIDIDKCSDEHLKALSTIIGYRWCDGLSADKQRESIKLFCLIRRNRGTKFGLSNLIRAFGQDASSYYTMSDLSGIEIIEYGSGGPETLEPNMFPGDINVRIPDMSKILRDSIFDTKLAGTRLIFTYIIFCGIFHLYMYVDFYYIISAWSSLVTSGFDPIIERYGTFFLNTKISSVIDDQLSHSIVNGAPIASCQILTYYKEKWTNGFVFNTPGLTNYRGFIEIEPTVKEDDIIYK